MNMRIQLPDDLQARARKRAAECGYGSIEEYVESLLRADSAEDQVLDNELEEMLLKRLDSGPPIPVTPQYIKQFKQEIARRRQSSRRNP